MEQREKQGADLTNYNKAISSEFDAAVISFENNTYLKNFTLASRGLIATSGSIGDTAILETPFNARGVKRKIGTFGLLYPNSVDMQFFYGETGDSGGLIVSREGVAGVNYGTFSGEGVTIYAPVRVFEELYSSLIEKDFSRK